MAWGELDYLVVDTPPGTSDEHMATVEALRPYRPLGALVVTTPQVLLISVPTLCGPGGGVSPSPPWLGLEWTVVGCVPCWLLDSQLICGRLTPPHPAPQAVSIGDVRRELTFCKKTGLQVIGVVENMSGFACPHCSVSLGRWVGSFKA